MTQPNVFDVPSLKKAEEAYRFVLHQEPDNIDIRVKLAWCLLLQAVYQSGQEQIIAEQESSRDEAPRHIAIPELHPETDAKHLLQECLHHSLTVRHLSTRTSNQSDMEKLEALVLLAGGKETLMSTDESGERIKAEIVRALQQSPEMDQSEESG